MRIIFFLPYISPNLPKMREDKNNIPLYKASTREIINRLSVYSRAIKGMNIEAAIQDAE